MKKSEGLFKLLYLKQSLLHQLKKPVLPSLWVLLLCKAGRMEQKGVGLKWDVRMKRLYEAITDQLLGWTWVSLSCFDWSAVAVLWGKRCQQCFGERVCLAQAADLAWSLASTSATALSCLSTASPRPCFHSWGHKRWGSADSLHWRNRCVSKYLEPGSYLQLKCEFHG